MTRSLFLFGAAALLVQGCVVGTAVSVAGDVAEGAVKTTAFAAKTTGKAAAAALPGDGDPDANEENDSRRRR